MEKPHTRRNFIRVVGGGIVLAASGTTVLSLLDGVPGSALEGWKGPDFASDLRRGVVSYAILAPRWRSFPRCGRPTNGCVP